MVVPIHQSSDFINFLFKSKLTRELPDFSCLLLELCRPTGLQWQRMSQTRRRRLTSCECSICWNGQRQRYRRSFPKDGLIILQGKLRSSRSAGALLGIKPGTPHNVVLLDESLWEKYGLFRAAPTPSITPSRPRLPTVTSFYFIFFFFLMEVLAFSW